MHCRWLSWVVVVVLWSIRAAAQGPSLAGQWNWGAGGGITEIRADGTGKDARGNTLQWTVSNAAARIFVLRWSHGYTDTVTLAADGMSLSGVNQQGLRFAATRVGAPPATAPAPVPAPFSGAAIVGEWDWGVGGGIVVIQADGSGRDSRGNTLKWTLRNQASRTYEIRWSHGYTDTATLAADANALAAVNNQGTRFTATRRNGVPNRPLDLNGSWSNGLLHIWQDGADVLVTATWKREDGKYVIWRGEGRLNGAVMELRIRYSPMPHGPDAEWRGILTASADGNTLNASYTVGGVQKDTRVYQRDR